jgi:hypothetical protein
MERPVLDESSPTSRRPSGRQPSGDEEGPDNEPRALAWVIAAVLAELEVARWFFARLFPA